MQYLLPRRMFLKLATLAGLSFPLRGLTSQLSSPGSYIDDMGVQLFTVRNLITDRPAETLKTIAEIGYKHVELAGINNLQQFIPMVKDAGLRVTSTHFPSVFVTGNWELWGKFGVSPLPEGKDVEHVIDYVQPYGIKYLVFPFLFPEERGGLEQFRLLADQLNRAGEKCKQAGIQFCYHNHNFEFNPQEGSSPFDIFISELDPDLVKFEIDVFWMANAGLDPVAWLTEHPGRCRLLHLKDLKPGTATAFDTSIPPDSFEEIGDGVIDFTSILRTAFESGIEYCYVEQDQTPGDPLASLRQSYQYLNQLEIS